MRLRVSDFCRDKRWAAKQKCFFPALSTPILHSTLLYVGHVFCSHSTICWCHGVEFIGSAWLRMNWSSAFQWQSQWYMWAQHWRHDSSLGRKSKWGKGHSIHRHRKIALLRKTFRRTSCSSTRSCRAEDEKAGLFAVSRRSLLMFLVTAMPEWRNRLRI